MGFKSIGVRDIFRKRVSLSDYEYLDPEVKELLDYTIQHSIKPNPKLKVQRLIGSRSINPKHLDFWVMPWGDLVLLRDYVSKTDLASTLNLVYGIKEKHLGNLEIFNCFSSYKWITKQLEDLYEVESSKLKTELDQDEIDAGAEELQDYGYYNALRELCPNMLDHSSFLKLPYSVIFRELSIREDLRNINLRKMENDKSKNSRNNQYY